MSLVSCLLPENNLTLRVNYSSVSGSRSQSIYALPSPQHRMPDRYVNDFRNLDDGKVLVLPLNPPNETPLDYLLATIFVYSLCGEGDISHRSASPLKIEKLCLSGLKLNLTKPSKTSLYEMLSALAVEFGREVVLRRGLNQASVTLESERKGATDMMIEHVYQGSYR